MGTSTLAKFFATINRGRDWPDTGSFAQIKNYQGDCELISIHQGIEALDYHQARMLMQDVYHALKVGGKFEIIVPAVERAFFSWKSGSLSLKELDRIIMGDDCDTRTVYNGSRLWDLLRNSGVDWWIEMDKRPEYINKGQSIGHPGNWEFKFWSAHIGAVCTKTAPKKHPNAFRGMKRKPL